MNQEKRPRNRKEKNKRRQQILWLLWCVTIVLIVACVLIISEIGRRNKLAGQKEKPAYSENVIMGEHIPQGEHLPQNEKEVTPVPTGAKTPEEPKKTEYSEETKEPENPDTKEPDRQEPDKQTPDEVIAPIGEEPTGTPGETMPQEGEEPVGGDTTEEPGKTEPVGRFVDSEKPMIAITFDDGPNRNNTPAILDIFEQYDGRATFFVVGYMLDKFSEYALDAYQRGFQIGNHTQNHSQLPKLSEERILKEIQDVNEKLNKLGIPGEAMFRPPYGDRNDFMQKNVTVPMIGWSVDSEDWKSRNEDMIYDRIVGKVKDGDIVLLHDLHEVTAKAMQKIVPALVEQGFQLVTVAELFEAKGIVPEAGKYYRYVR